MKRSRSPIRDTKESLSHLTRKQLQQKAKTMNIKANMKTADIIEAIIKRLREDEEIEEQAASTRRVSHSTTEQPQVAPVAPIDNAAVSRNSRSRTRTSPPANHETEPSNSSRDDLPQVFEEVETRCAKRRRVAAEEFEKAAEDAAVLQEVARKAQQKAEVALAVALRLENEGEARMPGQTIYIREPTPIEPTPNQTPVPSRANSPEEVVALGEGCPEHGSLEAERSQGQPTREIQVAKKEDEERWDKENGASSDDEIEKENLAPPRVPPSLQSEEHEATAYQSRTQSAGDSSSPVPPPKPITKANIREAHRKLAETIHKLTNIRTEVKRGERTLAKMEEHSTAGAKTLEGIQWKTLAIEENLLRHVKRNPTLLDGNSLDKEIDRVARQEEYRHAYYNQRKKDREDEEVREYEKERAKRDEEAVMIAAEANRRAAWGDEDEDEEEEGDKGPDRLAALIERGGDLADLLLEGDEGAGPSGSAAEGSEGDEDSDDDDDEDSDSGSGESAHGDISQEI